MDNEESKIAEEPVHERDAQLNDEVHIPTELEPTLTYVTQPGERLEEDIPGDDTAS